MKVLTCVNPGVFEYSSIPDAVASEGNSLLRIRRIGICGTDLHAFEGTQPYFNYPRVLGHELAGEIVTTDNAAFEKGEIVVQFLLTAARDAFAQSDRRREAGRVFVDIKRVIEMRDAKTFEF